MIIVPMNSSCIKLIFNGKRFRKRRRLFPQCTAEIEDAFTPMLPSFIQLSLLPYHSRGMLPITTMLIYIHVSKLVAHIWCVYSPRYRIICRIKRRSNLYIDIYIILIRAYCHNLETGTTVRQKSRQRGEYHPNHLHVIVQEDNTTVVNILREQLRQAATVCTRLVMGRLGFDNHTRLILHDTLHDRINMRCNGLGKWIRLIPYIITSFKNGYHAAMTMSIGNF